MNYLNVIIAVNAFLIAGSFLYLAIKYRVKRLAFVFACYGFLFLVGAFERVGFVESVETGWLRVLLTVLVMLSITVCAWATVKCVKHAVPMFSQMAVLERRVARRIGQLGGRLEESEIEAVHTLTEVRDMMRSVLNEVRT